MEAPIVTLTTDWGEHDFFVGMVKGRLCSLVPDVRVFDISHCQEWNDTISTVNIIRHACLSFPPESIHIIDVGSSRPQQLARGDQYLPEVFLALYRNRYFLSSDLRLLELSFETSCEKILRLNLPQELDFCTFLAYHLFCPIVQHIVSGSEIDSLGEPCQQFRLRSIPLAPYDDSHIDAAVTHIDKYGNAILNVTYEEFEQVRAGRRFTVSATGAIGYGDHGDGVRAVSRHYNDVGLGNLLLTVSVTGYLQLALNKASATQLLGLKPAHPCRITFID